MSFLRPVLPGLLILIAFLSSTRAQSVASSSTPAGAVSDDARQQAANALRAAGENLFGGNAAIAERAALDAVRLDPSLSSEAYPLAVEAAWQAAALPPRRPADRAHAEQLLGEALARHPLLPQLELIRARMKLHDGAIAEAEAIARAALERFRPTASASDLRLQEASFAALVHASRGEWKPAAKLIIDSESWLPGYDFHAAAAEILEHALREGNTSDDILRYTRNAYVGAHDFLRHRERGPEISANESRQLELLTQLGHWDLILEFLRETILPTHTGTATDAHLLSLLEPVSQAGITAFLRETEAAKKKTSVNLAALTAVDDVLASLLPRFSREIRFIEIRFDWTHALALALLRDDATGSQKARAAQSVDAAEKLLPLLDADWRRHVSVLPLLNRLDRRSQAETFARQLFTNAVKLGVTTSEQWSALGNAIEFSHGTGTVFTEVAFSCYERAVQIDTKTNHLNFAAIIGKLRLGALNNLKPEDALDLVNQLAAQFPAEASARESEVFFVRKRLCQLIVDDRRPLDAALAYVKLAQLTPKDAFTYHYNAASSLVDYITAQSESSVRFNRTLPDVRTGFVLPSVEAIFDQMVAQYPNAPDRVFQLRAQKERLSVAIAHGAVRADTSQWSAAETTALADSIGALRLRSPAFQKDEFLQLEAFVHVSRLNAIARRSEYTQASLDEARMRRDRVIELGGPNVSVARSNYDAILSRNRQIIAARENARRQQIAEQQRQREAEAQAAAFARSQPRPEPEPRWRWCLRCSGSGYRTVWDRAQNSYTGRFETAQMNRTCDQCFGRGKLPY